MTITVFAPTAIAARRLAADWQGIPLRRVGTPVRASGSVMGRPIVGTWLVEIDPLPRAGLVSPHEPSSGKRIETAA